MAENLKKFFKKKKLEMKFKRAGPGQRLCDESGKSSNTTQEPQLPSARPEMSAEAKQAAAAAMARLQSNNVVPSGFGQFSTNKRNLNPMNRPTSTDRKREESDPQVSSQSGVTKEFETSQYAADGVYFRCPLLSPEVLSKSEWRAKIKEYLYEQIESERGLTAALIIHNCNNNIEKVKVCTEILCTYLRNILDHPDEEKYQKIRLNNKAFQDKVKDIEGALEFLHAAGFSQEELLIQGRKEDYLVFSLERVKDIEYLRILIEVLENAERMELELDRNVQILLPAQAERRTQLPDEFYRYTPEELKKEHQSRQESLESSLVLRTKAMREKHEQKEMRRYKYALIRVRFPDGIFLQGTFSVYEKYEEVIRFVEEHLITICNFSLLIPDAGKSFEPTDYNKTLMELRLVPAAVLIFRGEEPLDDQLVSYLKPDVIALMQNL